YRGPCPRFERCHQRAAGHWLLPTALVPHPNELMPKTRRSSSERRVGRTFFVPAPDVRQHDGFHVDDANAALLDPAIRGFECLVERLELTWREDRRLGSFWHEVAVAEHLSSTERQRD